MNTYKYKLEALYEQYNEPGVGDDNVFSDHWYALAEAFPQYEENNIISDLTESEAAFAYGWLCNQLNHVEEVE